MLVAEMEKMLSWLSYEEPVWFCEGSLPWSMEEYRADCALFELVNRWLARRRLRPLPG
ncbi:MAG: hypothetical protein PHX54_11595 [Lentimicrobiaceae bacterium]|nr:hypothetical protein [Lentimicrobiaceae bacterium]